MAASATSLASVPRLPGSPYKTRGAARARAAFTGHVLAAAQTLYRVALRRTCNPADAQDALQQTLLKALTRSHQFVGKLDGPRAISPWLHRIAANQAIDTIRRRHAERLVSLETPAYGQEECLA